MKHPRALLAAFFACWFAVAAAFAAEASPAGTWTWTGGARQGKEIAITLKLDYANGKLSGFLLAPSGGQFPDTPIAEASFEGGVVRFQVKREASGVSVTTRFEGKLEKHGGQLVRAAVEMAKDWRTDRYLRRLEALLIVADTEATLMVSGNGDVMEPEPHGVLAIGSGGSFAAAAARALVENTPLSAHEIVEKGLHIAADICIYTNHHLTIETLRT